MTNVKTSTGENDKKCSLLIGTEHTIYCTEYVVKSSGYLSDMRDVFETGENLPVPDFVNQKDVKHIISLCQVLEVGEDPLSYLVHLDLDTKLSLVKTTDFLRCSQITEIISSNLKSVLNNNNWSVIYSSCMLIMGLLDLQLYLTRYFLHKINRFESTFTEAIRYIKETMGNNQFTELFMKKIIDDETFDISEEIKHEVILELAMGSNGDIKHDFHKYISDIHFECFNSVDDINQVKTDMSQLKFIKDTNLPSLIEILDKAIQFKATNWDVSYLSKNVNINNIVMLNRRKKMLPWPKYVGLIPNSAHMSFNKWEVFGFEDCDDFFRELVCPSLDKYLSNTEKVWYRSSVFYIYYNKESKAQLFQYNFDSKANFHVLDLPSSFRSVNDIYHQKCNRFSLVVVNNFIYIISKDAFQPVTFDTMDKLKIYRLDLKLAEESCNYKIAVENAHQLRWNHFTDIPEEFVNMMKNQISSFVKTVCVGDKIFIITDDFCISVDEKTKQWEEHELESPSRTNPIVCGSSLQLFLIGGSCRGNNLLSCQMYNTLNWSMELMPSIPQKCLPSQDLSFYQGMFHKNYIFLVYFNPSHLQRSEPILVYDLFLKRWKSLQKCNKLIFLIDKPIWL